jgi:hypothetical protein
MTAYRDELCQARELVRASHAGALVTVKISLLRHAGLSYCASQRCWLIWMHGYSHT